MQTSDFHISRILSYILHPLLIPTLVTSALLLRPDLYPIVLPGIMQIWFLTVVFVFTLVIPVTGVLILLKFNALNSIEMNQRNERTIPLIIASTSFMVLLYSVKSSGIPPIFLYMLYSATFALLAGLLINLVYKISLHTLGWGAMVATLISISFRMGIPLLIFIVLSIGIAGFAGYARLKQNAHNQAQVYLGYVAGVLVIILISVIE